MRSSNGLLLCASGIALICLMDAIAKALGSHLNTFQIVFVRYAGAALWLGLWITLTRQQWPRLSDLPRVVLRGCLFVVTASMFFYAVAHLPLAVVAALGMTAPVYVTVLGGLVFKERLGPTALGTLALAACGSAIVVLGKDLGGLLPVTTDLSVWAAAVLAPVIYALTLIVLKQHSGREAPEAMTLGQSAIAAILVLPLSFGDWPALDAPWVGLSTAIGLVGAVAFLSLTYGLRIVPVSAFAVLDYTALLWAAGFGLVFFREVPSQLFWLGAALIVVACSLNVRKT
jgi:S-adenosylmethionine uptake transporter